MKISEELTEKLKKKKKPTYSSKT